MGALRGLQEFSGFRDAGEHHCLCLPPPLPDGELGGSPGGVTYLQGHSSVLSDTSPKPISIQRKQAGSTGYYRTTWPAHQNSSGSVGQCPGHPKYMLGFYQLAKTTPHTQPTQRPLLHMSTFSRQGKLFCLTHINKQKVKQNENISQMKGQEKSPEKNLNRA